MRKLLGFTLVEIMIVVAIIGLLAMIAIPSFVKARETSQKNACINNLRQISGAKDMWAIEHGGVTGELPDMIGVSFYIKGGYPECPAKGEYYLNPIGSNPVCSLWSTRKHIMPR